MITKAFKEIHLNIGKSVRIDYTSTKGDITKIGSYSVHLSEWSDVEAEIVTEAQALCDIGFTPISLRYTPNPQIEDSKLELHCVKYDSDGFDETIVLHPEDVSSFEAIFIDKISGAISSHIEAENL